MNANTKTLPRKLDAKDGGYTLRNITTADETELLNFARALPVHDLLYLRRDIRHEKVTAAWLADVAEGNIDTIVAETDGKIVGTAALLRDPLSWSPHLGEVRVLVAEDARGTGLGRALIEEIFLLAAGSKLVKLTARMTIDQKAAIAIFEELGFRGEALLKDHVLDEAGKSMISSFWRAILTGRAACMRRLCPKIIRLRIWTGRARYGPAIDRIWTVYGRCAPISLAAKPRINGRAVSPSEN